MRSARVPSPAKRLGLVSRGARRRRCMAAEFNNAIGIVKFALVGPHRVRNDLIVFAI
jgi:hypothetical protein